MSSENSIAGEISCILKNIILMPNIWQYSEMLCNNTKGYWTPVLCTGTVYPEDGSAV